MKIALLGLRLSVGTRLIVDTLGPALAGEGHDVVVVGEPHSPPAPLRGVPVSAGASYPAMLRQSLSPGFRRRVVRAAQAEQPDVCYFLTVHPANGLLAGALRRAVRSPAGRPPVVAVHIHDPLPHPGPAWPLIFAAQQLAVRRADRVVVYGDALVSQIHRLYGVALERIVAVPHGASRPPRAAPPPETGYRHFSFVGRIDRYKGLEFFLAAARRLAGTHPEMRFRVAGAGSLRPYRRDLDALGGAVSVDNRVLTNDEVDQIMQASWAVVLPYTSGTQSGVIPLACWNACPVITTAVGALAEAVREGQTGFLVPPRDPDALARQMARLWNNANLRRSMGQESFRLYDARFRWERIAVPLAAGLAGAHQVGG